MPIRKHDQIDELRWELDRLVDRRTTGGLSDGEYLRYQELCDEECKRLHQEHG